MEITVKEVELTPEVLEQLIAFSEAWEKENCCHGYYKNTAEDIRGNRIFLAYEDGQTVGYLFCRKRNTDKTTSIYTAGKEYYEIEELYVTPEYRSRGNGKQLFRAAERAVADEVEFVKLGTATKNFRAILHFYIDELGLEFWCATLIKKIR